MFRVDYEFIGILSCILKLLKQILINDTYFYYTHIKS